MKELSLETAMIILENFDAVALTNAEGKYIYANQKWFESTLVDKDNFTNLHPWDVLPDSKTQIVISTKKPFIGHIIHTPVGADGIVSYYPIIQNGSFYGVLIWVMFTGIDLALQFAQKVQDLSKELIRTKEELNILSKSSASYSINNIIGKSRSIIQLKQDIMNASRTNSTVLIEGETGVGKELVAHSIHDLSKRSDARFVRVNCSAIPSELMESEFFGYDSGSFTGASKQGKLGKFELAKGGSLFLDEISSLPISMQPKLLRVLQEHEIERIGGTHTIPIDARIISATNQPLEGLIENQTFRMDLYYRLNVIKIKVPPLRERKEDIPLLVRHSIVMLNKQLEMDIEHVENDVFEMLMGYDWPGNIRELQNAIERAMNQCYNKTLTIGNFTNFIHDHAPTKTITQKVSAKKNELEYSILIDTLAAHKGNKTAVAHELGISRTALYKKLKKYNITM